jgi:hypothetical protein
VEIQFDDLAPWLQKLAGISKNRQKTVESGRTGPINRCDYCSYFEIYKKYQKLKITKKTRGYSKIFGQKSF